MVESKLIQLVRIVACALSAFNACGCSSVQCDDDSADITRPDFWTRASHCRGVTPDYGEVFDDQVVHIFEISLSPEDHQSTLDDMDDKYSGGSPSADLDDSPKPIWVPVTVRYDGKKWTEVGMRYKGHSSLKAAWQSGVRKLSFILDFDRFEDDHPDLRNQRFFGFNRLAFGNGYNDPALVRDKLAADIFRAGGVPAARTSYAAVYVDWNDGPVYFGVYTIIEDPADQMLDTQLGNGSGNLYKPWGDAARWLDLDEIGVDEVAAMFERSTNDEETDFSDITDAIRALHVDRSDPASWRAGLETVFDVANFLRVLAINQVMMNWDSYGCMHHNYFVYANPVDGGRLVWFPWDLNEAMLDRRQEGCPEPGSIMLDEIVYPEPETSIDSAWPLISFLLADEEYRAAYQDEVRAAAAGAFAADRVIAELQRYHDLVAPFVVGPTEVETYPYSNTTIDDFESSLSEGDNALEPHVWARRAAVDAAVGL